MSPECRQLACLGVVEDTHTQFTLNCMLLLGVVHDKIVGISVAVSLVLCRAYQ